MKKLTLKEFIDKATKIHNNLYTYDNANYVNNRVKININCAKHGAFLQTPNMHLNGQGCRRCGYENNSIALTKPQNNFVNDAIKIHGNLYIYDNVNYINSDIKVSIKCAKHGDFLQRPQNHLNGQGCPECYGNKKKTVAQFIDQARKIHGNLYNYDEARYFGDSTKINIICLNHGGFLQKPTKHLIGQGCPKCANKKVNKSRTKSQESFVNDVIKIHGNLYAYDNVNYINNHTKINITCSKHGDFLQIPQAHLNGQGCPRCNGNKKKTTKEFIDEAIKIHGDSYTYNNVQYFNNFTKVNILCKEHGDFLQSPWKHLNGQGCPKCISIVSEKEIEFLNILNIISRQKRFKINKKLIIADGYDPNTKTIYEFYGDFWHAHPTYHSCLSREEIHKKISNKTNEEVYQDTLIKEEMIKKAGYRLIVIWEHEFDEMKKISNNDENLFKNKIKEFVFNQLNCSFTNEKEIL